MMNQDTMTLLRLHLPDDESNPESYKRSFTETGVVLTGFLETSSPDFAAMVEGQYGRVFRFFCDDAGVDIRINDRLVAEDDNLSYEVKGVLKNKKSPLRRLEILLTLPIEQ
jgi:hypothetical protein